MMDFASISTIAGKEARDALRNRWFLLYTAGFAILTLGFAWVAMAGAGQYGFAGFGRTSASLINLVLLVVPLMGLTAGAQSLAGEGERGTLAYLLAQPVSRSEVLLGKFLGQALALGASLVAGFGASGLVLAFWVGPAQAGLLVDLVGLALLLGLASLSLGFLISTLVRRAATAMGVAVFTWLALALLGDLALMGTVAVASLGAQKLFALSLLNPLQVFRMGAVLLLRSSLEALGPAGLYAVRTYGASLLPFFLAVLTAWILLPLGASLAAFRRRDIL